MASKDKVKKSKDGLAFEVIIKPPASNVPPTPRVSSSSSSTSDCKGRELSRKDIDRKIREAENHKKMQEKARLEKLKKHDKHAEEVRKKKEKIVSETPR